MKKFLNRVATALAKMFEGYKAGPYRCPAGVPTSGWGHAWRKTDTPRPLPPDEADVVLAADLAIAEAAMIRLSPSMLYESEERKAAIIDFIFNLGAGNYQASTLRRKINAGDWVGARQQIGRWVFAGGKKLNGLVRRREAEARLM